MDRDKEVIAEARKMLCNAVINERKIYLKIAKQDLYKQVTDRIISQLEQGTIPWRKPWSEKASKGSIMPRNALTGRAYSGVNVLLLWAAQEDGGYPSSAWLTYKQAQSQGGTVRRSEKGTKIVFVSFIEKEDQASGKAKRIPFLRDFTVFNIAQCDGLPLGEELQSRVAPTNPDERSELAENLMAATGATIRHGESRAYYRPAQPSSAQGAVNGDYIMLPAFETFHSSSAYYETAFHELVHWSGAEGRLDRTFGRNFGDEAYSAEELVAELGSAFVMAEHGFDAEGRDAAYIAMWIKYLKDHDHAIVSAASMASKAVDYLRNKAVGEIELEAAQAA